MTPDERTAIIGLALSILVLALVGIVATFLERKHAARRRQRNMRRGL